MRLLVGDDRGQIRGIVIARFYSQQILFLALNLELCVARDELEHADSPMTSCETVLVGHFDAMGSLTRLEKHLYQQKLLLVFSLESSETRTCIKLYDYATKRSLDLVKVDTSAVFRSFCNPVEDALYIAVLSRAGCLAVYDFELSSLFSTEKADPLTPRRHFEQNIGKTGAHNVLSVLDVLWAPQATLAETKFLIGGTSPFQAFQINPNPSEGAVFRCIFSAANESFDSYGLQVKASIADVCPLTSISPSAVGLVTSQAEFRLYDFRAGSKPQLRFESLPGRSGIPLTRLTYSEDSNVIISTDNQGNLYFVDVRAPTRLQAKIRDAALGTITDIVILDNLLCFTSLDRFLRIYDIKSRNKLAQIYLVQQLTCLVALEDSLQVLKSPSDTESDQENVANVNDDVDECDDKNFDETWSKMDTC